MDYSNSDNNISRFLPDFPNYKIYADGLVINLMTKKIITPFKDSKGRLRIVIRKDRLLYRAYIDDILKLVFDEQYDPLNDVPQYYTPISKIKYQFPPKFNDVENIDKPETMNIVKKRKSGIDELNDSFNQFGLQ